MVNYDAREVVINCHDIICNINICDCTNFGSKSHSSMEQKKTLQIAAGQLVQFAPSIFYQVMSRDQELAIDIVNT